MKPRARRAALLATLLLATAGAWAQAFRFAALGDMPYGHDAYSGPAYRHLIELINRTQPVFSIHVGDFKDGVSPCSDELYARQHGYFQRFESALVFTPGDNDWVDCQRSGGDPFERLEAVRERFFGQPLSQGQRPLAVQRQGELMPEYRRYRENLRWWHQDVLFATFHTVGPDNNADPPLAELRGEHYVREAANAAWIRAAFVLARERGARALVFATQGDPLRFVRREDAYRLRKGFGGSIGRTLVPLAQDSGLPVLLVHGDSHRLKFEQPFFGREGRPLPNLWRLEVPGEPRMHAVSVRVDPAASPPFEAEVIHNPMSQDPRH